MPILRVLGALLGGLLGLLGLMLWTPFRLLWRLLQWAHPGPSPATEPEEASLQTSAKSDGITWYDIAVLARDRMAEEYAARHMDPLLAETVEVRPDLERGTVEITFGALSLDDYASGCIKKLQASGRFEILPKIQARIEADRAVNRLKAVKESLNRG